MKKIVLVFYLFFLTGILFAQTTSLPDWCNRVSEFAGLTSNQLQSKFPSQNVSVNPGGETIIIQEFPGIFSISVFSLNSRGNVNRWHIFMPALIPELNFRVYDGLVNDFTAAYGEPRGRGSARLSWGLRRELPEKVLLLVVDIDERGVHVIWQYAL